MRKDNIDGFAKKFGFTRKEDVAYKKVKDYMVTVSTAATGGYRCCISIDEFTINELDKRGITRFINKNYEKYKIAKFRWDESGIDVTFQKIGNKVYTCFTDFVSDVTNELQKVSCKGLQACAICGRPNDRNSALFYLYGFICGVHKACMEKFDEETNVTKVNTKRYNRGNVLSGIFGAIWGSFIGSIFMLLGFAFFGDESIRKWLFALAFLIPIAVKFYYEVFDGKKHPMTKFIVVAIFTAITTVGVVSLGNAIFSYSTTRNFELTLSHPQTLPALGVAGAVMLLLNYSSIKVKGVKQAYKVD